MFPKPWPTILSSLLLAGCMGAPPVIPDTGSPQPTPPRLSLEPTADADAEATLAVDLRMADRAIQTLPTTWDTATLRLEHPSVLTQARLKTLAKGSGLVASGSTYVASSAFGGSLRPHSGYVLTIGLWNGGANATLVGEKQVTVTLVAGTNRVSVPLEVYPALSLSGFTPTLGIPGTVVSLSGQGFSVLPSLTQLTFGTAGDMQAITPTALSSTSITATLPSSVSPGSKTWQVQVGSSLAARSGFTVQGIIGSPFAGSAAATQQQDPAIACGNGQFLAAWTDSRAPSGSGIYGVRMTSSGSATGPDIAIASSAQSYSKPAIAFDSQHNRFLVAYEGNSTIMGQLVNADGTLQGGSILLGSGSSGRTDAEVAYDATHDQYLVVWADTRSSRSQIYGQRVAGNGALLGSNTLLLSVGTTAQSKPHVAYSATADRFLVASTHQSSPMQIMGVVLNSDASTASNVVTVASGPNNQTDPCVATDPVSGDFLVVWKNAVTGFRENVSGQRVSSAGALVGGTLTASSFSSLKQTPQVAYEAGRGSFLVAWGDARNSDNDVYAIHLNLDGTTWGSEFPVISQPNAQSACGVAVDPVSRHGLVFYQETSGTNNKVYGQLTYY